MTHALRFAFLALALALLAGTGCSTLGETPATRVEVLVLDDTTGQPIPGAKVMFGWEGSDVRFGPFITDARGEALIQAPSRRTNLYWGGYLPYVNVVADQYQPNGLMGSSTRGRFTVHLHRIR